MDGDCEWKTNGENDANKEITIRDPDGKELKTKCSTFGKHNTENMVAAMCAVASLAENIESGLSAMVKFKNVRRRLEFYGEHNGVHVFDDFAHHPTAIKAAISAVKSLPGERRLLAIVEFRSNSLIMGANRHQLANALENADEVFILLPQDCQWDVQGLLADARMLEFHQSPSELIRSVLKRIRHGDTVLSMSNSSAAKIPTTLVQKIKTL
jgi:UDP-N-acetylmuramate: L-alanyl-gamma-D-glutamyl-meso-diaminopimelate ligase